MNKRVITLTVTNLDTIMNIKEKIQSKFKISVDHQPVLLQEEQLQDDHVIKSYDITQKSLLEINLGT